MGTIDEQRQRELMYLALLEPCSFHGRTPSCAQALVQRGIGRVYISILDPDPRNNGAGVRILQSAGITVTVGLLEDLARRELGPYLSRA